MIKTQPEFSFLTQGVPEGCYKACPRTNFEQFETDLREATLDAALAANCGMGQGDVVLLQERVVALSVRAMSVTPSEEQRAGHTGPWEPNPEALAAAGMSLSTIGTVCCQSCKITLRVRGQSVDIPRPDPS